MALNVSVQWALMQDDRMARAESRRRKTRLITVMRDNKVTGIQTTR